MPPNQPTAPHDTPDPTLDRARAAREMAGQRCPLRFAMEMLGDKWTLLIIRDMLLFEACRYGELQTSLGDISTNILASRLKQLTEKGLLEKFRDPDDGKSAIYLLTDKGLGLLPVLAQLVHWGLEHDEHSAIPNQVQALFAGGYKDFLQQRKTKLAAQRTRLSKR